MPLQLAPEVAEALAAGRPVVALESTLIAHGLPRPANYDAARRLEAAVREAGAVPATVAVLDGRIHVGLTERQLERVAAESLPKLGLRDLAVVVARGGSGATTVAATAHAAALAGIETFATGGLGGVHRALPGEAATWDISGDLRALADTPVVVVCSGVKSILDIGATLELLETLNVPVLGWRTRRFPAFYVRDSGHELDWQVDRADEVAAVYRAGRRLGRRTAVVVANPVTMEHEVDPRLHRQALEEALAEAARRGVRGKDVTPFLLARFVALTGGRSLEANVRLVEDNARLAAELAGALAAAGPPR